MSELDRLRRHITIGIPLEAERIICHKAKCKMEYGVMAFLSGEDSSIRWMWQDTPYCPYCGGKRGKQ